MNVPVAPMGMGMNQMAPGAINPGMGMNQMAPGMGPAPGMPPMIPGRMSGMDRFKQILLWIGWIVTVIAIICLAIVYFMSKGLLEDAQSNYDHIDKVRAKTVEAVKVEINKYMEAAGMAEEENK